MPNTDSVDLDAAVPLPPKIPAKQLPSSAGHNLGRRKRSQEHGAIDQFLGSIRRGNKSDVQKHLEANPSFLMYSNQLGVSALEEAVQYGNFEMVDLMIRKGKNLEDRDEIVDHALLFAIKHAKADDLNLVELLLKEKDRLEEEKRRTEESGSTQTRNHRQATYHVWSKRSGRGLSGFEDAEFPFYVTPIVLAAQLERLEIVQLLLRDKRSEIHSLTVDCPFKEDDMECEVCQGDETVGKTLEGSKRRLEVYKALSSPAFMFFSGVKDPIHECFMLSWKIAKYTDQDRSLMAEYEEVSIRCESLAREIVGLCRNHEEVETVLSHASKDHEQNIPFVDLRFPLIAEAIFHKQKRFIAHPFVQHIVQADWNKGFPAWVRNCGKITSILRTCLLVLGLTLLWPFNFLYPFLRCCSPFHEFMRQAHIKFVKDAISHAVFITFIILDVLKTNEKSVPYTMFTLYQWVIFLFVLGRSVRTVRTLFRFIRKKSRYVWKLLYQDWRWFNNLTNLMFWIWIILQVTAYFYKSYTYDYMGSRATIFKYHPFLFAEAAYCIAVIMSIIGAIKFVVMLRSLGPLQISLKAMVVDIMKFMLLFFIIITAFVMGISRLYKPYEDGERYNHYTDEEPDRTQSSNLVGMYNTYRSLFWWLFQYEYQDGLYESVDVVVDNSQLRRAILNNISTSDNTSMASEWPDKLVKHKFTEAVGYAEVAVYHVIAVVLLINMLIAMMAHSYQEIVDDCDTEWKFGRIRLKFHYYQEEGAMTPPFNLLAFIPYFRHKIAKKWFSGKECTTSCCGCCECCQSFQCDTEKKDYRELMSRLTQRYFHKHRRGETFTRNMQVSKKDYCNIAGPLVRISHC